MADPLADVRQDLQQLKSDLANLQILSTHARGQRPALAGSLLDQIAAVEAEMQRLTDTVERIDHQSGRMNTAFAMRLADLETRLCAMEEGCDASAVLPIGVDDDTKSNTPVQNVLPQALMQADRAKADGRYEEALILLASFDAQDHPLDDKIAARQMQVEVLHQMQRYEAAAKAALDGYGMAPKGPNAADLLWAVGVSFDALDKSDEACLIAAEVGVQFPDAAARVAADDYIDAKSCP